MPELPEVESTARFLQERLVGASITDIWVGWSRTIQEIPLLQLRRALVGMRFSRIDRRGKFVVAELRREHGASQFLLGHMRMSGSFDVVPSDEPRDRHDRVVFNLSSGKDLRFNDPRKFGRLYLPSSLEDVLGALGVEPLAPEFSPELLQTLLQPRKGLVKSLLLKQELIAGIGNIYADEALWNARVHPRTRGCDLTKRDCEALHQSIQRVLCEAIEKHGTDYGDGVVVDGMYQPRVYARTGQPCERCRTRVRRIVVGQRGTHFCPRCQRQR